MTTKQDITQLSLAKCKPDDALQSRAELDSETVDLYAEDIRNGAVFPPVVVFHDKETGKYWLASGFHRWHAHQRAGRKSIEAKIIEGDRRAAILFSVGANEKHGLRRTNADKRHAVRMLLSDEEWWLRTDNWIAEQCKVSRNFVGDVREEMQDERDEAAAVAHEEAEQEESPMSSKDIGDSEADAEKSQPEPSPAATATATATTERQGRHRSGQVVTINVTNQGKGNRQRPAVILIERDPGKRKLIEKQEIRSLPKWIKQCKRLGLTLNQAKEKLERVWQEIVGEAG